MDCRNHPGAAAVGACAGCAESYCENCLVDVRGTRYCASCKGMAITGAGPKAGTPCKDATDALKMAAFSFFCFGFILGPLAISKALKAKKTMAADPSLTGVGRANAAIAMGSLALLLWLVSVMQRANGRGP